MKRPRKPPADPNQAAAWIVDSLAGRNPSPPPGKNPAAVALGRLGGFKGGKARAAMLTSEERVKIARKAAKARWRKKP